MRRRSYLTTYRRDGGGTFASVGKLFAALLAFFVLIALIIRLIFPGALTTLVAPIWRGGTAIGNASDGTFTSRTTLVAQVKNLTQQNEALQVQNAALAARAADFERLLGSRTEHTGGLLAGVLVRPPVSPYDVFVVDQGGQDGVHVGNHAQGPGGVPLGTVTEAAGTTARITLYSSTGMVTEGWIGDTRIPVKLIGTGAGGYDAEIAGNAGAKVGDLVYVPGPGALPIGVVADVGSDPSSPRVTLRIRPYVNPFSLTWVTITP